MPRSTSRAYSARVHRLSVSGVCLMGATVCRDPASVNAARPIQALRGPEHCAGDRLEAHCRPKEPTIMTIRRAFVSALVILAVALASGATAAPPKDAIVIGLLAEPVTMDPPQITDLNSARITKRIFEGLVAQEVGSYKLVPGLAQSWDISKDGLTYSFKLRPNVTFHDGTPFNAEAVRFCFDRQMNEQGPYYKTGTYPYVKGFLGNVQSIEVVDPLTVQIKLKAPLTPFLQYLAHQSLFVYSPDALKKYGKDMVKNPVGTGPFKLETWEPGVKVVLARND